MELELDDRQKQALLKIARDVVEAKVTGKPQPPADAGDDPVLNAPCGCFVTLHVVGKLRGCIGTFQAKGPLCMTIVQMADAALGDPRFLSQPVRTNELGRLEIEISVLSPLVRTDDPGSLVLGKHGIYIRQGFKSGCFLPQVADQAHWSAEEFLSYCCSHKAGLPEDAWKDPETEVLLFTAEVFSENDFAD